MNRLNKEQNPCQDCILNQTDKEFYSDNANPVTDNMLMWEYVCHQCQCKFKVPVPHGPTEEKSIKCTRCCSNDITRENIFNVEMAFCGG